MGRFRASRGDRASAQAFYDKAIGIYGGLPAELRERDSVRSGYAVALKRAGALLLADGKLDEGERRYKEALALDEALVARHPDNATYRYDMTFSLSDLAFAARKRGDPAAARALWTRALEIRQAALDADSKNVRAMQGVASLHGYLGAAAWDLKQYEQNVAHRRQSLRLVEALIAIRGATPDDVSRRIWAHLYLAASLIDVAESRSPVQRAPLLDEASGLLQRADPDIRTLASRPGADPGMASVLHTERARLQGLR
jgi:tetratricopeptide (TPR) repeat protein